MREEERQDLTVFLAALRDIIRAAIRLTQGHCMMAAGQHRKQRDHLFVKKAPRAPVDDYWALGRKGPTIDTPARSSRSGRTTGVGKVLAATCPTKSYHTSGMCAPPRHRLAPWQAATVGGSGVRFRGTNSIQSVHRINQEMPADARLSQRVGCGSFGGTSFSEKTLHPSMLNKIMSVDEVLRRSLVDSSELSKTSSSYSRSAATLSLVRADVQSDCALGDKCPLRKPTGMGVAAASTVVVRDKLSGHAIPRISQYHDRIPPWDKPSG